MAYRIRQLRTGWQYLDKGLYGTYGKGYGQITHHPVFAFLLELHDVAEAP